MSIEISDKLYYYVRVASSCFMCTISPVTIVYAEYTGKNGTQVHMIYSEISIDMNRGVLLILAWVVRAKYMPLSLNLYLEHIDSILHCSGA